MDLAVCCPRKAVKFTHSLRTSLVRIVYSVMLVILHSLIKKRWWHGLSTMLGCSMSRLSEKVTSSPMCPKCWPPLQSAHDPDPQSTQQDDVRHGRWPIWHHSWDADSCWWGSSWADNATGGSCFQQHIGKRASSCTSIGPRVKPLIVEAITVWS